MRDCNEKPLPLLVPFVLFLDIATDEAAEEADAAVEEGANLPFAVRFLPACGDIAIESDKSR